YFQYVNAKAIANWEPFAKYYGGLRTTYGVLPGTAPSAVPAIGLYEYNGTGRLTYDVTAREMLVGVIYSVLLHTLRFLAPGWGDGFLLYTFFGVGCDLLVLFPLLVLARRYHAVSQATLFSWLMCSNACLFVVIYYTWFK